MVRDPGALTVLTSKSLSRHSVVQILRILTSKSRPTMPVFSGFDFRMALAPQRGANFANLNFQKCSGHASFQRLWLRNRSRAQAWCKFWRHLGMPILRTRPLLGADFARRRSQKTVEKRSAWRNYYPRKPPHLTHLSCIASVRSRLLVDRPSAATLSIVVS